MIEVKFYKSEYINEWNNFLINSKGQTFMFNRSYMDYHSDRFIDRSLMIYEKGDLVAMMPATLNVDSISITSHSGLTFGSFIVKENLRTIKTIEYFYHCINFLNINNISYLYFKQIPIFYSDITSDEVDYANFILEAEMYRVDIAYVIQYKKMIPYQERRIRSIKKAVKYDIEVKQEKTFESFWNEILIPNLSQRFGVNPVHSLEEITELANKNEKSIVQFNAYLGSQIIAGTTLFITPTVVHAQYISASDEGRKNGGLDFLFDFIIKYYSDHKKYFDFGIINENSGKNINQGLLDWKEGFGARAYAHRFYKIDTFKSIKLLKILQ